MRERHLVFEIRNDAQALNDHVRPDATDVIGEQSAKVIDADVGMHARAAPQHLFAIVQREERAALLRIDDDGDRNERKDRGRARR